MGIVRQNSEKKINETHEISDIMSSESPREEMKLYEEEKNIDIFYNQADVMPDYIVIPDYDI